MGEVADDDGFKVCRRQNIQVTDARGNHRQAKVKVGSIIRLAAVRKNIAPDNGNGRAGRYGNAVSKMIFERSPSFLIHNLDSPACSCEGISISAYIVAEHPARSFAVVKWVGFDIVVSSFEEMHVV